MSRTPGSGYGRLIPFQYEPILPRMAVTARNAGWRTSRSFFRAERDRASASNASAAWARCSGLSVFVVPSQVNETRTAAMVARSRWAGVVAAPTGSAATARLAMWSSKVVIEPPADGDGDGTKSRRRRDKGDGSRGRSVAQLDDGPSRRTL